MGRTLHYEIFRDGGLDGQTMTTIETMQKRMNRRFSWSHGVLSLSFARNFLNDQLRDDGGRILCCVARGFTTVDGDEWNAFLVVQFLLWVSRLLPDALVTVRDEGGYLRIPFPVVRAGVLGIDTASVERLSERLIQQDGRALIDVLQDQIRWAETHGFCRPLAIADVMRLPELKGVRMPASKLGEDVSFLVEERLLAFPWQRAKRQPPVG